ncbi:alpha/beta hydrolase [Paenibacillus ginsengarvi]|uniref:Esterase family protein n=1 Tax=Paenibacillus ginsengarvi TaxID=400777 RepID=A0A3B0CFG6_9BACL|nr:alpha/beta hydrolase family protein [Paenibacillus ginsengarvi]RKN84172.1 esterase family protein [Paenibacillus ginsengarvi]
MAFIQCNFSSKTLSIGVSMNVILPETKPGQSPDRKIPTLYLLHGLSDDHTAWMRYTAIERYARTKNLAIVMPAVNRSFYTDMAGGYPYWTFVSEELLEVTRAFFPLSDKREDTFAAGLSMGGYGAFKLGLRRPDLFAAVASLSGALDLKKSKPNWIRDFGYIFGADNDVPADDDLFALTAKTAASSGPKPLLYQACGTEDFLYEANLGFRDHARSLGFDLTYEDGPGNHTWELWDAYISKVLNWLPIREQ